MVVKSSSCVKGCNKYQKGTAKNLRFSLPLLGNSEFENFINHGLDLTLAQSFDSGKLQIRVDYAGLARQELVTSLPQQKFQRAG